MIDKEKVLSFVKNKGPVLPRDVSKEFNSDTFITGAILSTLVASKDLKISNAKIGGSPVYYAIGQEEKLSILYNYLPNKEKEAYNLLKEKKILRDNELEPSIRVALKNIKDFAKPIEVNINDQKEIFWRWYLTGIKEAELLIKEIFSKSTKSVNKINKIEETIEQRKEDNVFNENFVEKETLIKNKIKDNLITEKRIDEKTNEQNIKKEILKKKVIEKQSIEDKKDIEKKAIKQEINKKESSDNIIKQKLKDNIIKEDKEFKEKEEINKKLNLFEIEITDSFLLNIINLFKEMNIEILNYKIIRKNNDIEMDILINTKVGKLNYFCKAKDKKRIDDKELSSIFVISQMKKLPVLYLTTGELTKKAKELLDKEFKSITIFKINN